MIGPTMRQGPHQAAQKSTKTGFSDCKTILSKVASVISKAIFLFLSIKSTVLKSFQNHMSMDLTVHIDFQKQLIQLKMDLLLI